MRLHAGKVVGIGLAVFAATLAFGHATAAADSIVYIKNNDVWLANPDGTNEKQVTDDGTAGDPYYSPTQANDGTILAIKGDDINAQFHRLSRNGQLLVPPFDHSAAAYPQRAEVSPNGELLAFHVKQIFGADVVDRTYFSHADRFTASEEITSSVNFEHPAWMSNDRVFLSYGAAQTYTYDIGDPDAVTWFAESDVQVRQPDITPANDRIVVIDETGEELRFFQTNGAPPAAPTLSPCSFSGATGGFDSPSWAPDGTGLAWAEGDGIWVAQLSGQLVPAPENCGSFGSADLVIPGASEPDWGPADVGGGGGGDTTPPETTIDSGPANGSTITTDSTSFGFSSNEAGSAFECKLDDGPFQSCTSPRQLNSLANGAHTFQVRATNAAGNTDTSPASRTFTVNAGGGGDTDPPETTILLGPTKKTVKVKKGKQAKFTYQYGSDESPVTYECNIDGTGWQPCFEATQYTLGKGTWTLQARAVDAAGNVDATPVSDTVVVKKKKRR